MKKYGKIHLGRNANFFSLVYFFIIHDNFVNLQAEILNTKI